MKELRRKLSIGKMAAVILLLLLGVIASPVSRVSAAGNYTVKVTGRMLRSQVSTFLDLLNAEREKAGLPAMQLDEKAMELAELRAAQSSLGLTVNRTEDLNERDSFGGIPLVLGTFVCDVPTISTPSTDGSEVDELETMGSDAFDFYYNDDRMAEIPINGDGITLKDAMMDEKTTRVGIAFYCGDPDECQYGAVDLWLMKETETESLIPYTGELTDADKTFEFKAPEEAIQFSLNEGTTKLAIGEKQQLRPFYRSIYGYDDEKDEWEGDDEGFYFDSDCGTWVSSDEDVAKVASDGVVTGVGPGTAEISFLLKDNEAIKYTCTVKVTLKQEKIKSLKSPKQKKLQVAYKKAAGADGYRVHISTSPKFTTKKILTTKKLKLTTRVRKSNWYYVKVRAYYIDKNGKKVYGKFSEVKKVKVK